MRLRSSARNGRSVTLDVDHLAVRHAADRLQRVEQAVAGGRRICKVAFPPDSEDSLAGRPPCRSHSFQVRVEPLINSAART